MGPTRKRFRLSFLAKVLVPVLTAFALLLGGSLWLVETYLRRELRSSAVQNLLTADAVFKNSEQIRVRNLLLRFRRIPNEPRFKAVCRLGDPVTLQALLQDLLGELDADSILYFSADGIAHSSVGLDSSLRMAEFERSCRKLVQTALAENDSKFDLVEVDGKYYDAIAVPSRIGAEQVGTLVVCVEIGKAVAQEFKQVTRTEVVFLGSAGIAASTLNVAPPPMDELNRWWSKSSESLSSERQELGESTLVGERFLSAAGHLDALDSRSQLRYLLFYSCELQLDRLESIEKKILLAGCLSVVVATLVLSVVVRGTGRSLRELRDAAEGIGRGDFSRKVAVTTRDECGDLGAVFNRMADSLQTSRLGLQEANERLEARVRERTQALQGEIERRKQSQKEKDELYHQLVESSRLAGMAEVATSVLHNVGNVLNSVNVSASMLRDRLIRLRLPILRQAVETLRSHGTEVGTFLRDDSKGRRLIPFLGTLSEQLTADQKLLLDEMDCLETNVHHLKEIVSAQQSHARVHGVSEELPATELMERAVKVLGESFGRHGIGLIRNFVDSPVIVVDPHKVLQILVNFLRNAKQSVDESQVAEKRVVLGLQVIEPGWVEFSVRDNGLGIPPENLIRIFQLGFTTKAEGHGFGLHFCANAAREMGGAVEAASEGPGSGATFTLKLPVGKVDGPGRSTAEAGPVPTN